MANYTRDEFIEVETVTDALKAFGFTEAYALNATNSMVQSEIRQKEAAASWKR